MLTWGKGIFKGKRFYLKKDKILSQLMQQSALMQDCDTTLPPLSPEKINNLPQQEDSHTQLPHVICLELWKEWSVCL